MVKYQVANLDNLQKCINLMTATHMRNFKMKNITNANEEFPLNWKVIRDLKDIN